MPCTFPKISARAGVDPTVNANATKAKTIPGLLENILSFIFFLILS
jgi:hypothetical protein